MRIAIFTLTKNRLDYTKRMLNSLRANTYNEFDHFVVDNGSTDGTVEFLKNEQAIGALQHLIVNELNLGIPVASNQALDVITSSTPKYDFIIKLDNDCEIQTEDWLTPLLKIIESFARKVILSPRVEGLFRGSAGLDKLRYGNISPLGHNVSLARHLGGICVVAGAEAYERFRFPKSGFMHGGNDINFSYHARRNGYELGYVEDVQIEHIDTTFGQHEKFPEYFKIRADSESSVVFGEPLLVSKLKRPWRRAMQIRKLHYLGLDEGGVIAHALGKTFSALPTSSAFKKET